MAKTAKKQATKAPAKQATKTASENTSSAQMNASSTPSNTNTSTTGTPTQPSTEPKLPELGYTTATARAQKGETSYTVGVEKTVRGNTPETSFVSSTVSSKVSTPKKTYTETEIAISRPDITIKSSYSHTTNFYDKDKKQPQNIHIEGTDTRTYHADAKSTAQGYDGTVTHKEINISDTSYDKKDNISRSETHQFTPSQRRDQIDIYDRGNLRRTLHADATVAKSGLEITMREQLPKSEEDYLATINSTTTQYTSIRGKIGKRVNVDASGNATGTIEKNGKIKEMSKKETAKALKDMRKRFEKNLEELGNAQTPEEYTKAIPSPLVVGRQEPVKHIFQIPNYTRPLNEVITEKNTATASRQVEAAKYTPEQIAQMKLNQLQQQK